MAWKVVHGLAGMSLDELIGFTQDLADRAPANRKRPPRPLRALTPLELDVLKTAQAHLEEYGFCRIGLIKKEHGLKTEEAERIVQLLRTRKMLEKAKTRYRPERKTPLREADENHPWYIKNQGLARWWANYFSKRNEHIPYKVFENEALRALLNAIRFFDESKGKKFSQLGSVAIRNALLTVVSREGKKPREVSLEELEEQHPVATAPQKEPASEEEPEHRELIQFLHDLHKERVISEEQLLIMLLRHVHALSEAKTGKVIGKAAQTVRESQRRATEKIRNEIDRKGRSLF